jgi:hypothetical protein
VRPGAEELHALARKYRTLVALCARRDQQQQPQPHEPPPLSEGTSGSEPSKGSEPPAAVLRSLAREFPGCLRELDTLGAAELARRAARVTEAADAGAVTEPWMAWIARYHELMRAALAIRRDGGAAADTAGPGTAPDAAFVADVMAPPDGRLGIVVLRRLARDFGVPAREIAAALFPVRRPSPYEL